MSVKQAVETLKLHIQETQVYSGVAGAVVGYIRDDGTVDTSPIRDAVGWHQPDAEPPVPGISAQLAEQAIEAFVHSDQAV